MFFLEILCMYLCVFDSQVTKKNLYEAMEKTMMGQWVKKPEEQEDFTYGPVFGC